MDLKRGLSLGQNAEGEVSAPVAIQVMTKPTVLQRLGNGARAAWLPALSLPKESYFTKPPSFLPSPKYLLSAYYVPNTILATRDGKQNSPILQELAF